MALVRADEFQFGFLLLSSTSVFQFGFGSGRTFFQIPQHRKALFVVCYFSAALNSLKIKK